MPRSSKEVLEQEFLQVRAKILELAAFYDRLSEADVSDIDPKQLDLLKSGCKIVNDDEPGKAARVQLLFSREYDSSWREKYAI